MRVCVRVCLSLSVYSRDRENKTDVCLSITRVAPVAKRPPTRHTRCPITTAAPAKAAPQQSPAWATPAQTPFSLSHTPPPSAHGTPGRHARSVSHPMPLPQPCISTGTLRYYKKEVPADTREQPQGEINIARDCLDLLTHAQVAAARGPARPRCTRVSRHLPRPPSLAALSSPHGAQVGETSGVKWPADVGEAAGRHGRACVVARHLVPVLIAFSPPLPHTHQALE